MKYISIALLLLSSLCARSENTINAKESVMPVQMQSLVMAPDSSILKGIFNKVVDKVTKVSEEDLVGTWNYIGSDCCFKSDNLLKKAGGEVAANQIEKKLDETFAKIGIKEGACSFTFNEDRSFTALLGKKSIKGTYVYDLENKKMTLSFFKIAKMNVEVKKLGSKMSLLFDADKILTLLTVVSSFSNLSAVKALGKAAEQYDGLLLGFQLKK